MEADIMPEGFMPRRRGRKPSYDISEVLQGMTDHPGRWLRYSLSVSEAQSAKRQLDKMGFEVAIDKQFEDAAYLYVRSQG